MNQEIKLKDLFELKYGSSLPEKTRINGSVLVFGSNGIVGSHNQAITKGKTIIVGRKGSIGKINFSEKSCFPIDTTYYIDETKEPCNLKWLYFILKKLNLESLNRAAAVPGLNRNDVYQKKIILPSIEKQNKTVEILEKSKKLKERSNNANDLLDEYLKAIFNEMFLKEKNKFEKVTLKDIGKLSMGGTPSKSIKEYWENGTINWMKSGDIKGDFITSISNKITQKGFDKSNTTLYPKDTVVIALNGQGKTRGTTAILKIETTSNQSVVGIMPDNKKILSEYLHYNLKLRYNELRRLTGDNERSGLNLSILRGFKMLLPPIQLQQKFAEIVEQVEKMKKNINKTEQNGDELFNSLMQKAFRGEL
ncbi:MAG: restriction endonuclease subunit S [Nanoarchaeota archaeon]